MPLKQKDYPHVKYWLATSWTDSKAEKDIFTPSPKPEKKKNGTFWFLEDASGAPLSDEQCTAITKRARQIFLQLNTSGAGAAKWGDIGNVGQDYYRCQMYSFFPDLRLCELDWKVNRLATETYSSWYRKRKGKLAVSVKQEDASAKGMENRVNGGISLPATSTQPPKRPGPPSPLPVESTAHAKKVKSGFSAPKPRPAWAARASPPETHQQPILDPFFDASGSAVTATVTTDTAMTAAPLSSSVSSLATPAPFPSPLSLPTSLVVPTCFTSARIQFLDSDSPGSRPTTVTTPLPQTTTTHEAVGPHVDIFTATTLCSPLVSLDGPDDMVGMMMGGEMTVSDAESSKAPVSLAAIIQCTC
jgi:hypothetical protein